ncbi:MAG: S-layer homology domain-containing protein, partial [Oscillospiraceae bacterium]
MRNLKRCITLFLSLAIMLSFAAGAVTFPDVPARSPTGEALQLLTALDVIGGYPDGSFGQDKTISMAEYLKILFVLINWDRSIAIFEGG